MEAEYRVVDLKIVELLQDARLLPLLDMVFFRDVLMSMVGIKVPCPLLSRFRAISAHLGWQALTLALNSQASNPSNLNQAAPEQPSE